MKDFTIYRNYGVLGAEKRYIYIHMEHHILEESVMMS